MLRLAQITRTIFCMVSMILTSLFALSLSGLTVADMSWKGGVESTVFLAVLFVLIGACIDIGKYLFWAQRQSGRYYGILSLALMGFSWLASCAFLVSSENSFLQEARISSPEYSALERRIESITQQITNYESLLSKRLGSSYHKQWSEGQDNTDKIAILNERLATLIEKSSTVGEVAAQQQVASSQFFSDIGRAINVSVSLVRGVGYGLLSLLLEISTLGMISLTNSLKTNSNSPKTTLTVDTINRMDMAQQQAILQLTRDILEGRIPPVLRTIKAARYGLDLDIIREVLRSLRFTGILEDDKRNSFKLSSETPL